jgi:drug/metabolite transporter (DMT)-like permease
MTADRNTRTGVLLALSAAFMWGVSGAVAADAFSEVSPARVAEARALITTAVLVPVAWWRGLINPQGGLAWFFLLGVNLAVVNVTFYWALERLGVGPGATIQFLGPIFVLVWMVVAQGRPVRSVAWVAAVVALGGVFLVTEAWQLEGADWIGVIAGLASAATFASYLILGERLSHRYPILTVMTWGFIFASVVWIVVQPLWTFPTDLSGRAWVELLWVGLIGTALPFFASFGALQRVAPGIVGVIATTEPVFAAAAAWVLLDQRLSVIQIIGALLVLVAVASIQRWGIAEVEAPFEAAR